MNEAMQHIATLKKMKATSKNDELDGLDRESLLDELIKNKKLI